MNMRFWRDWVVLWAVMPWFSAFLAMALIKKINPADPTAWLHHLGTMVVLGLSLVLCISTPYFVIKRYFPRYGIGLHVVSLALILAGWAALIWLLIFGISGGETQAWFDFTYEFSKAVSRLRSDTPFSASDILALPWWTLFVPTLVMTAIPFAVPVFILCVIAGRSRAFFYVIFFVMLASIFSATSDAFFEILGIKTLGLGDLNGIPWRNSRWYIFPIWY